MIPRIALFALVFLAARGVLLADNGNGVRGPVGELFATTTSGAQTCG
jgi:hypothetical protein